MNINNELANVDNWMRKNKLSINFSKTEYMLISRKKEKSLFKIFINDNEISNNDHIKYLSVLLDNKLTWHYHIEKVRTKVIEGIWAIARLKNLKSKSNLHYTRRITPKRVTSCGAHLRGLAPGQHSSEETSQQWRVVGDTVSI